VLCAFRDVTEYRRLERDLVEATTRETERTEGFEKALGAAEARARELESARAVRERETADLRAGVARLESSLQALTAERDAARAEAESLHDVAAQRDALASERDALATRGDAVARERDALAAERAALEARVAAGAVEHLAWTDRLDHAERIARSGRLALARLADLETALATVAERGRLALTGCADSNTRDALHDVLSASAAAAMTLRQLRREAGVMVVASTPVAAVVGELEPALKRLLGPDVTFTLSAGQTHGHVPLGRDHLEQIVIALVANRRAALAGGGQTSLEVAAVDLDDVHARERAVAPGPYVVVALRASGPGVTSATPADLLGVPAPADAWRAAGPGIGGLFASVTEAGGYLWAATQPDGAIVFEVHLPRVPPDSAEAASHSPATRHP
jgi:hypothetical protein